MNTFGHILVVGVLTYIVLIIMLRISGKRTLSKWNAFDFIVTIALGSILATALITPSVTLVQSIAALATILVLQFVITFTSVRSIVMRRVIKADPALLLYHGRYQYGVMRRERVVEAEIRAAIRGQGGADIEQITAVILETDGSFSVIKQAGETHSALCDVDPLPAEVSSCTEPPVTVAGRDN